MKKSVVFVFIFFGILSCKKNDQETTPISSEPLTEGTKNKVLYENCYVYYSGGSKILLQFSKTEKGITGNLDYALSEKDANSGTFSGSMKGDTLVADYTFSSEGKISVREIVFLRKGDQFLEGFGDVVVKDNNTRFADKEKLQFNETMPLQKTDCN